MKKTILRFDNGISLAPAFDGRRFLGIGEVRIGRTQLRNPALPWTLFTETPDGLAFDEFELRDVQRTADGAATLVFTAAARPNPRTQEADATGDARIASRRLARAEATFRWTFRPVTEVIAENTWHGLAMQVEVDCPGNPVHWLIEQSTWEIGGNADGCTLVQQDASAMDLEQSVRLDGAFSTTEKFHRDGDGGEWSPVDMMPRAAGAAIIDFQAKDGVAMCIFAEKPGLTRARLDKYAGENVIHYTDRPFFALTDRARPPERKLLVFRRTRPLEKHEWRNLWLDCHVEVRRRILGNHGFNPEVPQPYISAHLWDHELKAYGAAWIEPLMAAFGDYQRLGYKQVFTHGVWESVTSDDTPGIEGNICAPYEFRFSDKFGGAAGMKRLADRAHECGLGLFQWFGFQHSTFAPVWKKHPDWILREAGGDPWDGSYRILCCGRMRSDFGRQLLDQVKQVRAETGMDGVFWDSYMNLGATCIDWQAPDKAPQIEEIWKLQVELQRCGYLQRCEIISIFGVGAMAMFGFDPTRFRRRLWTDILRNDDAFALFDTSPAFFTEGGSLGEGKVTPGHYFWLAGHRCVPSAEARPWDNHDSPSTSAPRLPGGALAEDYARVNRFYNKALPRMHRLRLTPGGKYTLWMDGEGRPSVIWAFQDAETEVRLPATDLEDGGRVEARPRLRVRAGRVYLLETG